MSGGAQHIEQGTNRLFFFKLKYEYEGHKKEAAIRSMTILHKSEIRRLFETTVIHRQTKNKSFVYLSPVFGKWLSGVSRRCGECGDWGVWSVGTGEWGVWRLGSVGSVGTGECGECGVWRLECVDLQPTFGCLDANLGRSLHPTPCLTVQCPHTMPHSIVSPHYAPQFSGTTLCPKLSKYTVFQLIIV